MLDASLEDILAYSAFPKNHRRGSPAQTRWKSRTASSSEEPLLSTSSRIPPRAFASSTRWFWSKLITGRCRVATWC